MAIKLSLNKTLYSYDNQLEAHATDTTVIKIQIYTDYNLSDSVLVYKQGDVQDSVAIVDNAVEIPGMNLRSGQLSVAVLYANTLSNFVQIYVTKAAALSQTPVDDDPYFTVDRNKRLISVPSTQDMLAVNFDENSEIITFKFPRYADGVDLSTKEIYVNYERSDKTRNKALCTLTDTSDSYVVFTWVVSAYATQVEGTLNFNIEFRSVDYRWQTQPTSLLVYRSLLYTGEALLDQPELLDQYLDMFAELNSHPPIPGDDGYWKIWSLDTHSYETSEFPLQAGKDGKSAYEYAVDSGYTGTEEEFAAKMAAGSGLTTAQINALDGMFKVCAFTKDDISAEYNAFCTAFGIDAATITGISATYSGGEVVVGTAVTDLTGIVVTANYSDGSKQTVTGYTLSGTIAEGSNTITVTYEGMTTTFTVTGVAEEVTLTSISVTYSGGDVPVGTAVADLTGIVVTANYSDGTSATVTGYTLSGTIAEGENTITVIYQGKSATFTVNGIAESTGGNNGWTDGDPYTDMVTWQDGYEINGKTGVAEESTTHSITDYLPCKGVDAFSTTNSNGFYIYLYDDNKNYIGTRFLTKTGVYVSSYLTSGGQTPAYFRTNYRTTWKDQGAWQPFITPHEVPVATPTTVLEAGNYYIPVFKVGYTVWNNTGVETEKETEYCTDFIFIKDFASISISTTDVANRKWVGFYDAEKNYINGVAGNSVTHAVPENAYYCRIACDYLPGIRWWIMPNAGEGV